MKHTKLVNSVLLSGIAVLMIVPSIGMSDAISDVQAEIERTANLTGSKNSEQNDLAGALNTLRTIPKIQEATGKTNAWNKVGKDADALIKRGDDRFKEEVNARLSNADRDASGWKKLVTNAGQMAQQMMQIFNQEPMPKECTPDFNTQALLQPYQKLDEAGVHAKQRGLEIANQDKAKAQKAFDKGLITEFQKMMAASGDQGEEQAAQAVSKIREILASTKDPKAFLKLAEIELKKSKDSAKAKELAAKIYYMDPQNGLLARLDKLEQGDDQLAEIAATEGAFVDQQCNTAMQGHTAQIKAAEDKCNNFIVAVSNKKRNVTRGMEDFNAQNAGQFGVATYSTAKMSNEESKWTEVEGMLNCNFQDAKTMLATLAGACAKAKNEISAETKNPGRLRDAITRGLGEIPQAGMQLAQATQLNQKSCKAAAERVQVLEQDSTRKDFASGKAPQGGPQDGAPRGRGGAQNNQFAGQPVHNGFKNGI